MRPSFIDHMAGVVIIAALAVVAYEIIIMLCAIAYAIGYKLG